MIEIIRNHADKSAVLPLQDTKGVVIMAYKITDACVSCGACADACPAGAISEGNGKYEIDADTCLECGSCAATCPNEAIVEE